MKVLLDKFIFDEQAGVWLHPENEQTGFNYSDGDFEENRIYNILLNSSDRSCFSEELVSKIIDWPTEYHFSPQRHNLLRHFKFNHSDKILELGCGCGAITRQLGETGAQITAVEGSTRRAGCTALRCGDLENVKVFVSNFQNIAFEQNFDYITLIGVLEYASLYFDSEQPFDECLKIIQKALKPEGKLIIAIENKLGLKYFNGLSEDHLGIPYYGIYNLYNRKTATTFGKLEISDLLNRTGYDNLKFQYPFPDYKLPSLLINEEAFNNKYFDVLELLRPIKARDYGSSFKGNFDEGMVWPVLQQNKLLQDFSNSFLIIANLSKNKSKSEFIAVKYSTDRRISYMTQTQFIADGDLNVIVNKKLLNSSDEQSNEIMKFISTSELYEKGQTLEHLIIHAIKHKNLDRLKFQITLWLDFVFKNGVLSFNETDIYSSIVKPDFIDCLPSNIIVQEQELKYIDKEWLFTNEFSIKFLFYKFWRNVLQFETNVFKIFYGANRDYFSLWAAEFQICFSKKDLTECVKIYNKIGSIVYYEAIIPKKGREKFMFYPRLKRILKEILPPVLTKLIKNMVRIYSSK
jgi:SAM-dependent methyltransferase